MGTLQQQPNLTFDPQNQSYLDYVNQVTGYGQFPAETAQPQQQQVPQQPKPQSNPVAQGAGAVGTGYTAYNMGKDIGNAITSSAPAAESQVMAQGLPSASSGYPATEAMMSGAPETSTPLNSSFGTAPAAAEAGNTFGVLGGIGPTIGLGGMAAMYAQQGLKAKDELENPQTRTNGGVRAALMTNPVTGWIPPVADIFGLGFSSGKHPDQYKRDAFRENARDSQWFDKDNKVAIEGGPTYDFGKDGGFTYGNGQRVYNIDQKDPNAAQGTGWLQPLAAFMAEGDGQLTDNFTGQFYNEITEGGKITDINEIRKRTTQLYNHFKLKPSLVAEGLAAMKGLAPEKRDAYLAAIDNLKPGRGLQVQPGQQAKTEVPVAAMGTGAVEGGGKQRVSPGVWLDSMGQYNSKDGVRR